MSLILAVIAAPFGAVVASFAATAGLRWARGEQALSGRSACDSCGVALGYGQTVPIVSYIAQRGACSRCRAPIARAHLVAEIAGLIIASLAFLCLPPLSALAGTALGLSLIAAAAADSACRRLPDLTTLIIALLGAGLAWTRGPWALAAGLAAALLTSAVLLIIRKALTTSDGLPGLGLGDVKLMAGLALWLGMVTPWAMAIGGLIGLIQVRWSRPQDRKIAFGPALAVGGWCVGLALQAGWLGDFAV